VSPAIWGSLSAVSLGSADFTGRFTSRAMGANSALFGILLVGSTLLTVWVWLADTPLIWNLSGLWLLLLNGISTMLMTLLLYIALVRGPVSIVAPIVASHPILVVIFWVSLGTRLSIIQWGAILTTFVGILLVARSADRFRKGGASAQYDLRITLLIAGACAVVYAVLVIAGQAAVPIYGELQTLWLARLIGLVAIISLFCIRIVAPQVPIRWWPILIVQGSLDAGGYLFLFLGSHGNGRTIAAITASTFGVITTLLARFILKEQISAQQWAGIALVFGGVAVLLSPL